MMTKHLAVNVVCLAVALVALSSFAPRPHQARAQSAGGPRVEAVDPIYRFGEVEQNAVITHAFILRNVGDADLIIERVRTSCGCTAAEPTKNRVLPGQTTAILVTFQVGTRRGEQRKTVTVLTNDPAHAEVVLYLEGMVRERLRFNPWRLFFTNLKPGQERSETLVVTNVGTTRITIREIKVKDPAVLQVELLGAPPLRLPLALAPQESVDLQVTFHMPADQQFHTTRFTLLTEPNQQEITYYISGQTP